MPDLKFCLRDWTKRTCRISKNWCINHRCPVQSIYIDDRTWELEFTQLRERGIPEAHVSMHMLRNRVGEFIDDLPISTFSLHSMNKDGSLGEWIQSFTNLDKAYMVANNQIAMGIAIVLVDDLNGDALVKMPLS